MSGADAVMVGRGAQGQPWLPGQIGRRIETGMVEPAPSLAEQLKYIRALYDEVCSHYGLRIGLRHARKASRLGPADRGPMQPDAGSDAQKLAREGSDIR